MSSSQRPLVRPMKIGDAAERIEAYRRAKELRVIAEDTVDEDCRVMLLRLAQSYDHMATSDDVQPVVDEVAARPEGAWPLKLRASNAQRLPRSAPRRTA
jgi:hypothetical protein